MSEGGSSKTNINKQEPMLVYKDADDDYDMDQ